MVEYIYLFWQMFGAKLFPLVWSAFVTVSCSLIFLVVRWHYESKPGYGTEAFSLLFAADLSVIFGTVEIWRVTYQAWPQQYYQYIAVALLVVTLICCAISVRCEQLSAAAKRDYDIELRQVALGGLTLQDPDELWRRYIVYWVKANLVRWSTTTLHLVWIVKTPRWALLP
jgi:hypothetical protein